MLSRTITLLFALFALVGLAIIPLASAHADGHIVVLETSKGDVEIRLARDAAPNHAKRIATLAAQGFYDNVVFHRVIDGFMAQTGDPTGTGSGGSDLPDLKAEFSSHSFSRGMVGMARSQNPNSANSQFFIMFSDAPHLNGQYTIVGEVVAGMDVIDSLKKGDSSRNGTVSNPDRIVRARVASGS